MAAVLKAISIDEFLQIRFAEGEDAELVKGEIHLMSPASFEHGAIAARIGACLLTWSRQSGAVVVTEAGFQTGPDTVRVPDVALVRAERIPEPSVKGYFPGAPDLVVEVVSPSDSAQELEEKIEEYFRHGTLRVWVIYPDLKKIYRYRSST